MSTRGTHRPTQRQIAAKVGVSIPTVSRILNPEETHPERWASLQTIEAVQRAAAELGYRRNALAVSLRTARSNTVGVLLPRVGEHPTATIIAGIDEVANEHSMMAITTCTLDAPTLRAERAFALLDRSVDGMIFADTHLGEAFLDSFQDQEVPFTLVHRRHPNHVSVTADDVMAGRLAAQHLIGLGRRRLGVINARRYMSTSSDRTQGFLEMAEEAGLDEVMVFDTGYDVNAGREAALAMLARPELPDGVFAIHDNAALGAISILRQNGVRIPEDVAVMGYYDTPSALATDLTSIGTNLLHMGRRATELLLDRLAGRPVKSEILPVTLAVRHSTDPDQPIGETRKAARATT